MGKKLTHEEFIIDCNNVHNNKYDYSMVKYNKSHDFISIKCKEHGVFVQRAYAHKNGQGCIQCGNEISTNKRKKSLEVLINEFNRKHHNRYDYSLLTSYKNGNQKISIICKEHGVFTQTVDSHLLNSGCKKCTSIKQSNRYKNRSFNDFVIAANNLYNSYYTYDINNYEYRGDVTVLCPMHGNFVVSTYRHLNRTGCSKCHPKSKLVTTSYIKDYYEKVCGDKGSNIYFIKMYNQTESFYKIGIAKNLDGRLKLFKEYNIDLIHHMHSYDVGHIWELERTLHKKFKDCKAAPSIHFHGHTECFNLQLDDVAKVIKMMI